MSRRRGLGRLAARLAGALVVLGCLGSGSALAQSPPRRCWDTAMTALFTRPPLRIEALTSVRTALIFFALRKKIGVRGTTTKAPRTQTQGAE